MIPILFEHNATSFTTHGLGDLIDCLACEAIQTEEGEYELALEYPMGSPMFSELTINRIVYAKVNDYGNWQAFRIYGYEKGLNGVMKVNCQHISYDITNIPVNAFKDKTSIQSCLDALRANAIVSCPFAFSTNISSSLAPHTTDGKFKIEAPERMRTVLLDGEESIAGIFNADLDFDNFTISLNSAESAVNRGVLIEYGVDLIDMQQEENISEMITGVYPYFRYSANDEDNTSLIAYGDIQYASGTFQKHNIEPLDLTEYFPNQEEHTAPSAAQLNSKAQEWIVAEKIGRPEINITLTPAALGKDIRMHDQVTVRFVKMGIEDIAAKVTSYKYDVLRERPVEIKIGHARPSILFTLQDASRLKHGLLPPERIQDKSLTSDKYQDGSVDSSAIGSGAVGTSKLANSAVTENKIGENSVSTEKIKDYAVVVNKISDGAIETRTIKDSAVVSDKILNAAVSYAKLNSSSVDTSKFTYDMQVTWSDILATNALFAGYIYSAGVIQCSSIIVGSTQHQTRTVYVRNAAGTGSTSITGVFSILE